MKIHLFSEPFTSFWTIPFLLTHAWTDTLQVSQVCRVLQRPNVNNQKASEEQNPWVWEPRTEYKFSSTIWFNMIVCNICMDTLANHRAVRDFRKRCRIKILFFKLKKGLWMGRWSTCQKKNVSNEWYDSNPYNYKMGIPQSSILGPLLFFLHINELL